MATSAQQILNIQGLNALLVEAVKELKAENDELRQILREKGVIEQTTGKSCMKIYKDC